jgi:Histidine kinase-, DNA gyrase B-, and HSP90-like ATPase
VLSLRNYDLRINDIELVTEFESELPEVVADPVQLQQALLNLILNAEQAMRDRAERRLSVGARFDRVSGAIELFVSDTGHGIDQADLPRVFDPFFTTRVVGEGTGLGLSICYGIVREHGGEIAVESRIHAGTTFALRLPARAEPLRPGAQEILVGHADQSERDFLAAALAAWGYRVVSFARPEQALARYRRGDLHAAFIGRGFIVANATGWSAAISEDRPLIMLAIAGAMDEDDIERFGREHACAVLVPPFQLRTLWSAVRVIEQQKEYA